MKYLVRLFTGSARLPRTVWLLVIGRSINQLGAFTLSFLSVALTQEFHASVATAGLLVAVFGAATLPSRLAGGWLADRLGPRATLVTGLALTAVAQLGLAAAPSLGYAVAAVVLLGLAFEIYEPPSQALIAEAVPADVRPAAYGRMSAGLSAAAVASGLIAAAVGAVDVRLLFLIDAITCLACAALMRFTLPARPYGAEETDSGANGAAADLPRARPWRDRRLMALLALGTVFASLFMQLNVTLPLTLLDHGIPASRIGLLAALAALTAVLSQPLLTKGRLADADNFGAMGVGYAVLGLGMLANGLASSLWQFALATVVRSVGELVLMGRTYSLVAAISPPHARGRYFSVYGLCWGFAAVLGPLTGTQLLARFGTVGLWASCAAACGLLAVAQVPMRRLIAASIAPQREGENLAAVDSALGQESQ